MSKAISYKAVPASTEPDGQNRSDNRYNETRILQIVVGQSSHEQVNNGDRSTTYTYEIAAPEHLSARRLNHTGGARENRSCVLYVRRAIFLLALVDLAHQQQRPVEDWHLPSSSAASVWLGFGECRNRDCEEGTMGLVVVTTTIRSYRLVVMLQVRASE